MQTISRWCLLLAACLVPLSAEIIDRIAITVGGQVITESQIDQEIRITAFLNRDKLDVSAAAKKKAADRLVEQALVKREMDLSHYPLPQAGDASAALEGIKATYPSQADFASALESYGINEADLTRRLLWQVTLLRFIEYRFRPGIQIPDADVQTYYRQQVSSWEKQGLKPIPSLEDSRDQIEEILTQKRIDLALDQWLAGARKQAAVNYHDATLADRDAGKADSAAGKE
jgi:peptidyl-prolyl cis-trans isomerase SurA